METCVQWACGRPQYGLSRLSSPSARSGTEDVQPTSSLNCLVSRKTGFPPRLREDAGLRVLTAVVLTRRNVLQTARQDGSVQFVRLFSRPSCGTLRKSHAVAAQNDSDETGEENAERTTERKSRPRKTASISSLLYRSQHFVDVEAIVTGMTPFQRRLAGVVFLGALAGVAWLRNLGAAGLVDDTEPLFVEAARQM